MLDRLPGGVVGAVADLFHSRRGLRDTLNKLGGIDSKINI